MGYKELKDQFLEEINNIDIKKMGIYELSMYADLLKKIAELPTEPMSEVFSKNLSGFCFSPLVPRKKESEE